MWVIDTLPPDEPDAGVDYGESRAAGRVILDGLSVLEKDKCPLSAVAQFIGCAPSMSTLDRETVGARLTARLDPARGRAPSLASAFLAAVVRRTAGQRTPLGLANIDAIYAAVTEDARPDRRRVYQVPGETRAELDSAKAALLPEIPVALRAWDRREHRFRKEDSAEERAGLLAVLASRVRRGRGWINAVRRVRRRRTRAVAALRVVGWRVEQAATCAAGWLAASGWRQKGGRVVAGSPGALSALTAIGGLWLFVISPTAAAMLAWIAGVLGSAEFVACALGLPALAAVAGGLIGMVEHREREREHRRRHEEEERRLGGVTLPMRPFVAVNRAGTVAHRAAMVALPIGVVIGLVLAPVGVAPPGLVLLGEGARAEEGPFDAGGYVVRAGIGRSVHVLDWSATPEVRSAAWRVVQSSTARMATVAVVGEDRVGWSLRVCGWFCRPRVETAADFEAWRSRTAQAASAWTLEHVDEWRRVVGQSAAAIMGTLVYTDAAASILSDGERANVIRPLVESLLERDREIAALEARAAVHRARVERFIPPDGIHRQEAEAHLVAAAALRRFRDAAVEYIRRCVVPAPSARPATCQARPRWEGRAADGECYPPHEGRR